jgi:hypothetical protein
MYFIFVTCDSSKRSVCVCVCVCVCVLITSEIGILTQLTALQPDFWAPIPNLHVTIKKVPYILYHFIVFCLFFLVGLTFELKTSHLQSRCSTAWAMLPVHFALVILEMGSCKLFPRADLLISVSQVARITGVSHWHPILILLFLKRG